MSEGCKGGMDAGIEVKVEDYDGTYVCLFCGESVRGQPALKCSHCSSNPFHVACVARADSKYAEVCPTCDRKTVEAWVSASGGAVAPSEIIDLRELESEGESAAEVAALTGNGARAEAVPAVGGTEVAADMVRRGDGAAGQAHAGSAQPEKQQGRECRKSSAGQRSPEEERAALNPARSTALEQAPLGGGKAPLRLSASPPLSPKFDMVESSAQGGQKRRAQDCTGDHSDYHDGRDDQGRRPEAGSAHPNPKKHCPDTREDGREGAMQLHEGVTKGGQEDHLEWDSPQAAHERCSELEKVKRERDEAKDKLELMERERDQTIVKLTEANDIVRSLTTELEKTKRERDKGTIELEKAKRERDEAETELNKTKDALAHQILGLNAPQSTVQQQSMRRGRPLRAQGPGGTA